MTTSTIGVDASSINRGGRYPCRDLWATAAGWRKTAQTHGRQVFDLDTRLERVLSPLAL